MFCPNCGGKLEDNWNVCPNCGTSLKEKQESLVKEKNSGENQDNIIQEDRYLSQSDGVKKKTGILGKIFGWGLVVFNVFFAMLMFTESIVAGVCSLASALLFCPKIWE